MKRDTHIVGELNPLWFDHMPSCDKVPAIRGLPVLVGEGSPPRRATVLAAYSGEPEVLVHYGRGPLTHVSADDITLDLDHPLGFGHGLRWLYQNGGQLHDGYPWDWSALMADVLHGRIRGDHTLALARACREVFDAQ